MGTRRGHDPHPNGLDPYPRDQVGTWKAQRTMSHQITSTRRNVAIITAASAVSLIAILVGSVFAGSSLTQPPASGAGEDLAHPAVTQPVGGAGSDFVPVQLPTLPLDD